MVKKDIIITMQDTPRVIVRSFMLGSLFGNKCHAGYLINKRKVTWQWADTDQNLIEWKAWFVRRNLKKQCIIEKQQDSSVPGGVLYTFSASSDKGRLRIYRKWFSHPDGAKRIGKKVQFFDNPMGLMVMVLDHGRMILNTIDSNLSRVEIELSPFQDLERQLLLETINKNFNLNATMLRLENGCSNLTIPSQDLEHLYATVQPMIPKIESARVRFDKLAMLVDHQKSTPGSPAIL